MASSSNNNNFTIQLPSNFSTPGDTNGNTININDNESRLNQIIDYGNKKSSDDITELSIFTRRNNIGINNKRLGNIPGLILSSKLPSYFSEIQFISPESYQYKNIISDDVSTITDAETKKRFSSLYDASINLTNRKKYKNDYINKNEIISTRSNNSNISNYSIVISLMKISGEPIFVWKAEKTKKRGWRFIKIKNSFSPVNMNFIIRQTSNPKKKLGFLRLSDVSQILPFINQQIEKNKSLSNNMMYIDYDITYTTGVPSIARFFVKNYKNKSNNTIVEFELQYIVSSANY